VSSPENKKIDFEKLTLSEDLSGTLEPLANGASEQLLPESEIVSEEKIETSTAAEEELAEHEEFVGEEGPPAAAPSRFKELINNLSTANPFNVLLAITVAALLIAILCCVIELGRYGFHISAKQARSTVTMSAPLDIVRQTC
jgi:hypothetical protein